MFFPSGDEDAVTGDLVSVLLTASRTLVAISASSLSEVEDMLTLSEFRALVILRSQGGCSVSALGRRLAVSPETSERIAVRLADSGWVGSSAEGVLHLTERGEGLVTRVTELRREAIAKVVSKMEIADRRLLVDALIAFARAAGEPLVTDPYPGTETIERSDC